MASTYGAYKEAISYFKSIAFYFHLFIITFCIVFILGVIMAIRKGKEYPCHLKGNELSISGLPVGNYNVRINDDYNCIISVGEKKRGNWER